MNPLFYLIYFVLWAYITSAKYSSKMKEDTNIHILQLGKLSKLFSYWELQACNPRKVSELTFEYKSL